MTPATANAEFVPPSRTVKSWAECPWLWAACLFLMGVGAKFWLISEYGSPLPFWDQWDAEAAYLYVPLAEGKLTFADLFRPHNEHRMFWSRVYNLALLWLNGQWDARFQMVVNAVIHSATMAGFGIVMARLIGRGSWPVLWGALAFSLVPPFAWENTLAGLHSQFYFLLFFSLVAMCLLVLRPANSMGWWLGWLACVLSLFTAASGFLAANAVFALLALRYFKKRLPARSLAISSVLCAGLTVMGFALKTDVEIHHRLAAHSILDFVIALGKNLAWPWIVLPFYAPLNMAPLVLLGWSYFHSKEEDLRAEEMTLTVGFWVLLQSAATAYARGAGGAHPGWRYMDSTSFVMIVNVLSLLLLLRRHQAGLPWLVKLRWASRLWLFASAVGIVLLCGRALRVDIPERVSVHANHLKTTRAFMATDDPQELEGKTMFEILYPKADQLIPLLRHPYIREILPACVRPALKVTADDAGPFAPAAPNDKRLAGLYLNGETIRVSRNDGSKKTRFESKPVRRSRLPYLEFEVAGSAEKSERSMQMIAVDGAHRVPLPVSMPDAQAWQRVLVPAPPGEFKLAVECNIYRSWMAFREPREMGRFSYWSERVVSLGIFLFLFGIVGWFVLSAGRPKG